MYNIILCIQVAKNNNNHCINEFYCSSNRNSCEIVIIAAVEIVSVTVLVIVTIIVAITKAETVIMVVVVKTSTWVNV